jgi:hypothetical protein
MKKKRLRKKMGRRLKYVYTNERNKSKIILFYNFNEIYEKLGYNYNVILIYFDDFLKVDFEKKDGGEFT